MWRIILNKIQTWLGGEILVEERSNNNNINEHAITTAPSVMTIETGNDVEASFPHQTLSNRQEIIATQHSTNNPRPPPPPPPTIIINPIRPGIVVVAPGWSKTLFNHVQIQTYPDAIRDNNSTSSIFKQFVDSFLQRWSISSLPPIVHNRTTIAIEYEEAQDNMNPPRGAANEKRLRQTERKLYQNVQLPAHEMEFRAMVVAAMISRAIIHFSIGLPEDILIGIGILRAALEYADLYHKAVDSYYIALASTKLAEGLVGVGRVEHAQFILFYTENICGYLEQEKEMFQEVREWVNSQTQVLPLLPGLRVVGDDEHMNWEIAET
jgi:hypothetical protein